ncbi:hypothetical protein F4703DRAFT_1933232 [Phycomyces blakesleeanus]
MPNENSSRVIFLIDTRDPLIDASKIKQIALQILLYFYDCVDKEVTWGYRFFNSESAAVDAAKYPLYSFTPEHINAFKAKCSQRLRQDSKSPVSSTSTSSFPFSSFSAAASANSSVFSFMTNTNMNMNTNMNTNSSSINFVGNKRQTTSYSVLKETMMQILAEFQWAGTDSYLSTIKSRQKSKAVCFRSNKPGQEGVNIKNHVYMITNCPDTYDSMLRYVGYTNLEDPDATDDQKIEHLARSIHFMAQDVQKSLLQTYIKRQISFNWINTLEKPNETEQNKSFQKLISHGLSKFLSLFGGHMIPYYLPLVNHTKYGCSFTTIFSSYCSSEIDTVVNKNSETMITNPAHSVEAYLTHIKIEHQKANTSFWEGEFYLGHDAYFLSERQGARKEYQVRLKPFFRTTRELPLEERNFSTSINDLFSRVNVFHTVALIHNTEVRAEWFENDESESESKSKSKSNPDSESDSGGLSPGHSPAKRVEFVMTSKEPVPETFMDLIDSLIASHQVILVDLQARRASRSTGPHPHSQALLQPLTSGFMNVILLTKPVGADELQSLESGARFPKTHPPETTQLDIPALLETAPYSIRVVNHYRRSKAPLVPIVLNESPNVLELLKAHKEKKKAEEEARSQQKVKSKPTNTNKKTVDTPIASLPRDEDEFIITVKKLYLEALYTGKWTHLGMMKNLASCTLDIITLLSIWTKSWIDVDNHHREIEDQLNDVQDCVDLEESRTKLQITLYLTILSLKKEMRSNEHGKRQKRHNEDDDGITNWKPMDRYSTLPEELVDIFLDRIQIWEVASSIRDELVEINAEREGSKTQSPIDSADISLRTFVKNVAKCFSDALPDVVRSYREKIDDDDDHEVHSSQTSDTKSSKSSWSYSNPKKMRKTSSMSKPSRTRSSNSVTSSSSTATAGATASTSSSISTLTSTSTSTNTTSTNRATRVPDLSFMRREVDLVQKPRKEVVRRPGEASRVIDAKVERSKVDGKPTIKRVGSFTTSARSTKPTAPDDLTQYSQKVQLRRPLSPTTPITRMSRQFGFDFNIGDE